MVRFRPRLTGLAVIAAAALAFALMASAVAQSDSPPRRPAHQFYGVAGSAMLDGAPAPDGVTVTATNQAGATVGSASIGADGWVINVDMATATSVTFQIDGSQPSRAYAVEGGQATAVRLDLRSPPRYALAVAAGADFVVWRGGVATSAVFEGVAGLRIVWWWSGFQWVGYVADPAAVAIVKPRYALATGDVMYVVAEGPVVLTLPAAPAADPRPVRGRYTLAAAAGADFVGWEGGAATSAVFEGVAGLRIVWWWSGARWVGYVADPGAPARVKPPFALATGDVLYVVADGRVEIALR